MLIALLGRFLRGVRRCLGLSPWRSLVGVRLPEETRKILLRERQRADRTGTELAVLAFTPDPTEQPEPVFAALAGILHQRLRATDELGWLADGVLAAILPHTGPSGARALCRDICAALPADMALPGCTIYIYPHQIAEEEALDLRRSGALPVPSEPTGPLEELMAEPIAPLKRCLDVLGAALGLLLLSPLLLFIALLIKATSRGPVLFRQLRSGRGGRPFWMFKFRTMIVDAEARQAELRDHSEQDGPAFKLRNDPRVTAIGRFLRKTSLDELPQLWNVLIGEMSLVGPRPLPCKETAACEGWQRRRLAVTPGLTCIWQVHGRSTVSFVEWMRMDLQYVRSRSLPRDLQLLLLTVPAVLLQKGAQ